MRIGLSGTPGTGKTSVASLLQKKGFTVLSVNDLASTHGFYQGIDKKRNTKILDLARINIYIRRLEPSSEFLFIEGHAAHLLTAVDKVILLRCHPQVLQKRLQQKGWSQKKIQENVDAEILDIILCEATDNHLKRDLFEIDTTEKTVKEIVTIILKILKNNFKPTKTYSIGQIDWSEEILKEFP